VARSVSRRQFTQGLGAIVVGFDLFAHSVFASSIQSEFSASTVGPNPTSLDSWLSVSKNGTITVFTSKVDLGTGVLTALSQVVAEELDVAVNRIRLITGDTDQTIDQSQTSGSRTLNKAGPQLRQAAAAARLELIKRASALLKVSQGKLSVHDGVVSTADNPSAGVSYWDLIADKKFDLLISASGAGAALKVASEIPAKRSADYKIVGTSVPRFDLPAKLTGEFQYSHDVRIPGMLHGRVIRPLHTISQIVSVDENSVKDIAGIVKIVRDGNFLGVVTTTEWSAIKAAETLKVSYSDAYPKLPSNREELYAYLQDTPHFQVQKVVDKHESDATVIGETRKFSAAYRWPFQMHGMIGPSCAVADVRKDGVTVWTGSQGPHRTRKAIAEMLQMSEANVRVIYTEGSGSYGRLCSDDVAEDAVVLSRSVRRPVRVQWMRSEEHCWEPKASAQLITAHAVVDNNGKIASWDFVDRYFPYTAGVGSRLLASRQVGLAQNGPGAPGHGFIYGRSGGGDLYSFRKQKIVSPLIPWIQNDLSPLRTCNLRAPGVIARCFASESFIDEIASELGVDPIKFRLSCELNDPRTAAALLAVSEKAGWQTRPSPLAPSAKTIASGRGVACANRDDTIVAVVAEVEVNKESGVVAVKRVIVAHDCGLVVNPDGVKNQIEGNVMQGVSRTLFEEVQFDQQSVTNTNWSSYRTLRFHEIPDVDIVLLDRPELGFLGAGEPSIIPIPAAISNAIFDATGARVRDIPLTAERVHHAIQVAAASN
jgi:nicotinate dehydrogenase subunit B